MVDVQVVSVLAFYSNDRSSKSTEIKLSKMLKNNEKNKKRPGMAHSWSLYYEVSFNFH